MQFLQHIFIVLLEDDKNSYKHLKNKDQPRRQNRAWYTKT